MLCENLYLEADMYVALLSYPLTEVTYTTLPPE